LDGGGKDVINYFFQFRYGFLGIYTLELVLKVIAKGFAINKFSYLRNRWNILDFVVVTAGYISIIPWKDTEGSSSGPTSTTSELEFLRTLRVLRAVKTISILPGKQFINNFKYNFYIIDYLKKKITGLRMMINALLSSVVQLMEVMLLTLFCLMIFALFALEVYMGKLRHKCVKLDPSVKDPLTDADRDYRWQQ
jgi:hypothetical protein